MKKITCVLAILAAATTAALAKDLKQDKSAPAPTVKAAVLNDAEMDKVTAGAASAANPNERALIACKQAGGSTVPFC